MGSENLCEPEILRDYLVELLDGKADLRAARKLSRKVANLQNEIERSLAKEGLALIVMIPTLKLKAYQSARLHFDPVNIIVRATENAVFNKSGVSAFHAACRVAAALQLHKPPFDFCGEIIVDDLRELNIISAKPKDEDEEDFSGWDVLAHTKLSITPRSTTN